MDSLYSQGTHFKALWLVVHSVGKMKTILKSEILEKHMKTTNIKIHQFTLSEKTTHTEWEKYL